MTVSNTSPLVENKTGNGVWTTISVTPGQILQNSDGTHAIKVIKTTIADGTTVTLAETTDYTVALDGTSPSTGTITLVAGAPSSAYRYTVLSNITPKQEVNLQNGTIVDMEDIESALDRLTLYAHKQDEKLERAVVLAEDTLTRDLTLDSLDSQAGKVLRVNSTEDGFDYVDVTDGISEAVFDISALSAIDSVVTSTDKLPIYDVSAGATKYVTPDNLGLVTSSGLKGNVQQIQYVNKTDVFTQVVAAVNQWYTVTGLSVTITPSSEKSKLVIGGFINICDSANTAVMRIVRDGIPLQPLVTTLGQAIRGHGAGINTSATLTDLIPFMIMVDAGTTNSSTIAIQVTDQVAANTVIINSTSTDTNSAAFGRMASHLYVMEVLDPINPTGTAARYSFQADTSLFTSQITSSATAYNQVPSNYGVIEVVPLSSSSYNITFVNASGYGGSTPLPKLNIQKGTTDFLTPTSQGSRLTTVGQEPGLAAGLVSWAGTEALSSTTGFIYNVKTSAATVALVHGGSSTAGGSTSYLFPSTSLNINFVTTTGSTFKQHVSSTVLGTETSSSIAAGSFHTTGLSTTITPNSSSNYLMVVMNLVVGQDVAAGTSGMFLKITRDGTDILVGDTAGSRTSCTAFQQISTDAVVANFPLTFILPATSTSSTTIGAKIGPHGTAAAAVQHVNRSFTDTDTTSFVRGVSQLSVIEIDPIA